MKAGRYVSALAAATVLAGAGTAAMMMPAHAASKGTAHATRSCGAWHNHAHATSGTQTVELQYNPGCQAVRAVLAVSGSTNGRPSWHMWVYNKTTGESRSLYGNSGNPVTDSISDSRHPAHACVQEYGRKKACTAYI